MELFVHTTSEGEESIELWNIKLDQKIYIKLHNPDEKITYSVFKKPAFRK